MKYTLIKSKSPPFSGAVRVKALHDFGSVKKGDIGGWVSGKRNLSHEGDCWIFDNAWVSDNAKVFGDAQVSDNAQVFGDARVSDGQLIGRVSTGYVGGWGITLSSPTIVTVGYKTFPIAAWFTEKVPWKEIGVTAAEKREIRGWIKLFCTPAKIRATFAPGDTRKK